jgi:hypothetical protein
MKIKKINEMDESEKQYPKIGEFEAKVPSGYIAVMKHEDSSDGTLSFRSTYDECVDLVHEFFLDYDFEVKDGKPYDSGHESGNPNDTEPFDCFDDVKMYNGKVAGFTHCNGSGPVAVIRENE